MDPGSFLTGREAPAPPTVPGSVSAKDLVGEYVAACLHRPPKDTLGHLGRKVRILLEEGFEPGPIRTALERLRTKGLHPSVLPSVVNEVLNAEPMAAFGASGGGPWASNGSGYTPYFNPTTPEPTTFGGGR